MARCLKLSSGLLLRFITTHLPPNATEGQSYLDELVANGKTAPKAAMTGSSTFRIKWGDGDFTGIHLMSHLHRAHAKAPRVSYAGDNFAGMSSVINKWLFRKMPNRRSCDELFPERLQIVLFTLRDPELNAVHNASADV